MIASRYWQNLNVFRGFLIISFDSFSLEQESPKLSCIGVTLNKELAVAWIQHIKRVLEISLDYLEQLKIESPHDIKVMTVYLHLLVSPSYFRTRGICFFTCRYILPGFT